MPAAPVIDGIEFAQAGGSASGDLALEGLGRLAEALVDRNGAIHYTLEGFINNQGEPTLRLRLSGELKLQCQRCLQALPFDLSTERDFVLSDDDALGDVADEDPRIDQLPATSKIDVADLVESETVLELPISPLHAPGDCRAPDWKSGDPGQRGLFEALGALKSKS